MSSLVAALTLTAALLYLNDALRVLPVPALGAILVAAAISLIDLAGLREIWRVSRMEFVFALIGMSGPITLLGVLKGVVIAVAATLLYMLLKVMRPRDAMLGLIPGQHGFYKMHRSKEARPIPGLAICLIQGSLLFFNVDYVKSRLAAIADGLSDTHWFVLDASAIVQVDSTAAAMLDEVCSMFAERGIAFGIAGLHSEPMDLLKRAGLLEKIGKPMIFADLEEVSTVFTIDSGSK